MWFIVGIVNELVYLSTNFYISDDLEEENKVLEWLINFKDAIDELDEVDSAEIEEVNANALSDLIENSDHLAVLFCKQSVSLIMIIVNH